MKRPSPDLQEGLTPEEVLAQALSQPISEPLGAIREDILEHAETIAVLREQKRWSWLQISHFLAKRGVPALQAQLIEAYQAYVEGRERQNKVSREAVARWAESAHNTISGQQ